MVKQYVLCVIQISTTQILSTAQLGVKLYVPANNPLFILTYIFLWKGGCISKEKNYFKDAIAQSLRRITYNIAEAYHFQLVKSLKIGVREKKKSRGSYCCLPSYWLVICRYFFARYCWGAAYPPLYFQFASKQVDNIEKQKHHEFLGGAKTLKFIVLFSSEIFRIAQRAVI